MSTIVIGAGPSGLQAARRLQERGEEVVILEARDCIGGRTRSMRDVLLHGQPADLGASWIDLGQDRLLEICKEFGLEITPHVSLSPTEPDGSFSIGSLLRNRMIMGGELLDEQECTALADEVSHAVTLTPPAPTETVPSWTARAGLSDKAEAAVLAQVGFMATGAPWRARMLMVEPPLIGKFCWMLADGTDSIAHALADGLEIRLEQPVRLIARSGRTITVESDHEQFTAEDVIVTTPPPPTLRIGFDPVLPAWKVNALASMSMTQGGKVIAQYSDGSKVSEALGHAVLTDGPISFVWARPLGPENTVVVLGLLGDRADGVLRDQERALRALDDIIRTVAGSGPERLAGILRDWTSEEFTGGVVSAPFVDQHRLTSLLAQQVGPIHFAGEHTDETFTTGMEGALRSGLRAADEVLQRRSAARR